MGKLPQVDPSFLRNDSRNLRTEISYSANPKMSETSWTGDGLPSCRAQKVVQGYRTVLTTSVSLLLFSYTETRRDHGTSKPECQT